MSVTDDSGGMRALVNGAGSGRVKRVERSGMGRDQRPELTLGTPRSRTKTVPTRERGNEAFSSRVAKPRLREVIADLFLEDCRCVAGVEVQNSDRIWPA